MAAKKVYGDDDDNVGFSKAFYLDCAEKSNERKMHIVPVMKA